MDMVAEASPIGFELSLSGREDGSLDAAYLRFSRAKVVRTDEVVEELLLADYDAKGRLVGIEILGPVRLKDVASLVDAGLRPGLRRFVRRAAPGELISA
jgi:hypothetical protein